MLKLNEFDVAALETNELSKVYGGRRERSGPGTTSSGVAYSKDVKKYKRDGTINFRSDISPTYMVWKDYDYWTSDVAGTWYMCLGNSF